MLKSVIRGTCLVCLAATTGAEPGSLSGQEIRDLFAGATVEINTPLGTRLPVRYRLDGELSGHARQLALFLGASSDSGRWWIAEDQLCHQWNHWFNSEPQCLRLAQEGRRLRWWNQHGNNGTAIIAVPPTQTATLPHEASRAVEIQIAAPANSPPAPDFVETEARALTAPGATPTSEPTGEKAVAEVVLEHATAASKRTKSSAQAQPEANGSIDAAYMVVKVARDDVLNVRSGPSTEFNVIGDLQPGSRGVIITGPCRSGWCPVQHASTSGWVNSLYLASEASPLSASAHQRHASGESVTAEPAAGLAPLRDSPAAPRACLTPSARALLARIEETFGPVKLVSTCRPGATIAGSGRPSRHASGNAMDFDAGIHKARIVDWLIANHHEGGTMTYADMDHIHVDIGPYFVAIAGGQHWASWRNQEASFPARMRRTDPAD